MLCDVVETLKELTCLDDRVRADGGCEAALTARTRCGWAKLSESGKRFPLKLTGAILQDLCKASNSVWK